MVKDTLLNILSASWRFAQSVDWLIYILVATGIFFFARSWWLFWRQEDYKHRIRWKFIEIKVPREVLKGPKAMEQFFQELAPLANRPGTIWKKWLDGEIVRYHTIDIIGRNNEVRFFMRISDRILPAVEGFLYGQYPEIEIVHCEDPLKEFPQTYKELSSQGYEIWGNELLQGKSPSISIKTYNEFEQLQGDEKGRIIDPFSVLLELISNLKPSEMILVQFMLNPDTSHSPWKDEAKKILEEFRNTTQQLGEDKEGNPQYRFRFRTPGEEGVIKRLEEKVERATFETTIRYIYLAPKEIYNFNIGYRGIQTFFNQFRHDRQSLDRNFSVMTKAEWYYVPFIFPGTRLYWRRHAFWRKYMERFLPEHTFASKLFESHFWAWAFSHHPPILSSEELATLFHIPTNVVLTAPSMERIESKRLAPPSHLPT